MTPCTECLFCFITKFAQSRKNDHDEDALYRMVDDLPKLTNIEVATKYKVAARTVRRLAALSGSPRPPGQPRASPERLRRAKEMLDDGAPYAEVERTLGMSGETVRRHLPGRAYTPQQIAERASIGRLEKQVFAKLEGRVLYS